MLTRFVLVAILASGFAPPAPFASGGGAPTAPFTEPVSFTREVVPILTKAGCNAGTCHGTPTGKNGFRLSLRGYDVALDIHTLTREMGGRRIDRIAPDRSLILQKGAGAGSNPTATSTASSATGSRKAPPTTATARRDRLPSQSPRRRRFSTHQLRR